MDDPSPSSAHTQGPRSSCVCQRRIERHSRDPTAAAAPPSARPPPHPAGGSTKFHRQPRGGAPAPRSGGGAALARAQRAHAWMTRTRRGASRRREGPRTRPRLRCWGHNRRTRGARGELWLANNAPLGEQKKGVALAVSQPVIREGDRPATGWPSLYGRQLSTYATVGLASRAVNCKSSRCA